jgi:hypothetical protein
MIVHPAELSDRPASGRLVIIAEGPVPAELLAALAAAGLDQRPR